MNLTHTVTLLEFIWTVTASIGLFFMSRLMVKSYHDRSWLINSHSANGDRHLRQMTATTSIMIFGTMTITQFSYLIVGVVAMTQPNRSSHHVSNAQIINSAVFIASSVSCVILASVIYIRRNVVVKELVDRARREHEHP